MGEYASNPRKKKFVRKERDTTSQSFEEFRKKKAERGGPSRSFNKPFGDFKRRESRSGEGRVGTSRVEKNRVGDEIRDSRSDTSTSFKRPFSASFSRRADDHGSKSSFSRPFNKSDSASFRRRAGRNDTREENHSESPKTFKRPFSAGFSRRAEGSGERSGFSRPFKKPDSEGFIRRSDSSSGTSFQDKPKRDWKTKERKREDQDFKKSNRTFIKPDFKPRREIEPHAMQGVFFDGKSLYTKNLVPGQDVYGERLIHSGKEEYREWNIIKSKLAAALIKGISQIGMKPGHVVLYLGAASGTTPSHVSDIVGKGGMVFALDFAPRVVRDLVLLSEKRVNMVPIMADAHHPEQYSHLVPAVDVVYQDIAQREQAKIFIRNCKTFLKSGGFALLSVKARSVDVSRKPKDVFREVRAALENEMTIVDYRELDPYEKDHAMFVCKKK